MASVSALEQWILESINSFRLDPAGTAARYGIGLNDGLAPDTISSTPKQVLAMSDFLLLSSELHNNWMLDNRTYTQIGASGSTPPERMVAAGFVGSSPFNWGEALAWQEFAAPADNIDEQSVIYNFIRAMFVDPQTRAGILNGQLNEIGISSAHQAVANNPNIEGFSVTQDLAQSSQKFITGAIYTSSFWLDQGLFYPSTGVGGVAVDGTDNHTVTADAGGYRIAALAKHQQVSIGSAVVAFDGITSNIKLDVTGESFVRTDHSMTVISGVFEADLVGIANVNLTALDDTGAVYLNGNSGANRLIGNLYSNHLDGKTGADYMAGGAGDDFYTVDNAKDVIVETLHNGFDTVTTSVSYVLGADAEVERIQAPITIFSDPINLTGNKFAQELDGNYGNNALDGGGGGDILNGYAGNDTYYIRSAADVIGDEAGQGFDRLLSAVSYTLGASAEIEVLSTTSVTGTSTINLTGNDFDQTFYGNAGKNILTGGGGADIFHGGGGADRFVGGMGDDIYFVDNTGVTIVELDKQGTDEIDSSVSFALTSSQSIEKLTLLGAASNATGNNLANTITGNGLANVLDGGGGGDVLIGGLGNDTYIVRNSTDQVIETASHGTDRVVSAVSFVLASGSSIEFLSTINETATTSINLTGNSLAQTITGNAGHNVLIGGGGNDTLNGGAGADIINGGTGKDVLFGGTGADTFVFSSAADSIPNSARDVIADWDTGDRIDFSKLDANTAVAGTQHLIFDGEGSPDLNVAAGHMRYYVFEHNTFVIGSVDADDQADFQIEVYGTHNFAAADFALV